MTKNSYIFPLSIDPNRDICSIFSQFAHSHGAILLDSANCHSDDGRYDFFCAEPIVVVSQKNQQVFVKYAGKQKQNLGKTHAMNVVQELLDKYIEPVCSIELPFTCGAMGYISYDYKNSLESLSQVAVDDMDTEEFHIGIYNWCVIKDNLSGRFYLVDQSSDSEQRRSMLESCVEIQSDKKPPFKLQTPWQRDLTMEQYQSSFDTVKEHLKAGNCYQINLTQRFQAQFSGSPWSAYLALRSQNKAPFSGYIKLDDGAILSISPERFIKSKNGVIETKPIKGTRPRGYTNEMDRKLKQELAHSEKDRAENLMIVDLLRNDLSRVSEPGSVKVTKLFDIESYPAVHHLVSTIESRLQPNKSAMDLLTATFPGGSITGAPKISAMEIIESIEPTKRSVYCGSLLYISSDQSMDSNIAIRTLLCKNNTIYCWAGGGIVDDSLLENEYQECFDKVNKILPVLESL